MSSGPRVSSSRIWPWVRVPVLSNTASSALASVSSAWPRVVSTPSEARRPLAAVSAAGVASDNAQGQEI
ncbi:hypothetical protein, partial [Chromobacterium piscinae]|uniref:hypothetical protein n=1 Tax=Chromobacterium piscinae TaxID=686831 RepID=UPI003260CA8E